MSSNTTPPPTRKKSCLQALMHFGLHVEQAGVVVVGLEFEAVDAAQAVAPIDEHITGVEQFLVEAGPGRLWPGSEKMPSEIVSPSRRPCRARPSLWSWPPPHTFLRVPKSPAARPVDRRAASGPLPLSDPHRKPTTASAVAGRRATCLYVVARTSTCHGDDQQRCEKQQRHGATSSHSAFPPCRSPKYRLAPSRCDTMPYGSSLGKHFENVFQF